jgi:hypothetical protein
MEEGKYGIEDEVLISGRERVGRGLGRGVMLGRGRGEGVQHTTCVDIRT